MVSARILNFSFSAFAICLSAAAQTPSNLIKSAFDTSGTPPRAEASPSLSLSADQRGDVFMARKMYREAIEAYRAGPANSAILANKIGIAYHQLSDFGAARKNYERAMKLDKNYADAVNNDGTVFYAQKKYRTAITRYRKAIAMSPDSASFWSNLGTAWYSRGRFAEMSEAYHKALSLDPNIFEHRGTVGTELQDRTVADRARYHYELARMYANVGKNELALQYLRRSLEEGLKDKVKMTGAPEFAALRETPEFQELLTLDPRVL